MQPKAITKGIEAVIEYCRQFHTDDTIKRYERAVSAIKAYYKEYGQAFYHAKVNDKIRICLRDSYVVSGYRHYRTIFRVLGMLDDYFNDRSFRYKYSFVSRYKYELEPQYQRLSEEFRENLTVTENTVPVIYSIARDFFYYLQQNKISDMGDIQQETLYAFMMWEYRDREGSMNDVTYVLRLICDHLRKKGLLQTSGVLFPFALHAPRKKVYPAFSREDMEKILSQPDTNTPSGKRDYAVLTLASVTGMRAIDIANLKLSDIQWKEMAINFTQRKTGHGLLLPLDPRAASAVSDYILNARPESDTPYVFVTEIAPYRKLNDKSSVANILKKHVKQAGIEKTPRDGKAFHAFRRNMGIWLLEASIDPELISQILGHHSRDVLKNYLPIATSKLGICALDFDGIQVRAGVYQ